MNMHDRIKDQPAIDWTGRNQQWLTAQLGALRLRIAQQLGSASADAEAAPPERIAQHDNRRRGRSIVDFREHPPERRGISEFFEPMRGHERGSQTFGGVVSPREVEGSLEKRSG